MTIQSISSIDGLTEGTRSQRLQLFGPNGMRIPNPGWASLFITELANPFYVFQMFSVILWSIDDYALYAMCILIISFGGIVQSVMEARDVCEKQSPLKKRELSLVVHK